MKTVAPSRVPRGNRLRRWLPRLALLAAGWSLLPAGCTPLREYIHNSFKVGPNYQRPPAPVAPTWIDADDPRVRTEPPRECDWWKVFNDPALSALVETAYRQNLTLREAAFRVLAARAQLCISVGNFFPQQQQAFADYIRKGLSETVANHQYTPQRWFSVYDLGFNLSWEIDIWGKLRRGIESANAKMNATIEDYDAVLVTLIGDVARAYTQIRTVQAQLMYTKTNVELQRKTLGIVKLRFEGGAVSKLDFTQAATNLARTEALVPPLEIQLRQANNQLCVLLGLPPHELEKLLGPGGIPTAQPEVAVGIPADLLRRRPDVRAAERRLAAQSAQIGIADANLYPALYINGTIGYATSSFNDLFNDQSIFGTWGPGFQWNILNYGRLINNVRYQDAKFQELAAAYQQKVLSANQEVENGLVTFLQSQRTARFLDEAVHAAQESVNLALQQYQDGKVDFNRVFLLQRELVRQQDRFAGARGEIAQGLIQTYRALGGGWQIRCQGEPPASAGPPLAETPPTPKAEQLPPPRKEEPIP